MPHGTTRLGSIEVTALCDLEPPYPEAFSEAFPSIPPERHASIRERYPSAFAGEDQWVFNDHCFLVRTPQVLMLFDTGVGGPETAAAEWLGTSGRLPAELEEAGVAPEDVDLVAISHAHLDHVGWNLVRDGGGVRPRFPNARYVLQRTEWEEFPAAGDDDDRAGFDDLLRPLDALGVLQLVDGEERLAEGVTLHFAPGHTPGHQVAVLESGGGRAVLSGDLANHPAQTAEPSWWTDADRHPDNAASTRSEWFERIESWNALLCTAHFPEPFGRLARDGDERIWSPATTGDRG